MKKGLLLVLSSVIIASLAISGCSKGTKTDNQKPAAEVQKAEGEKAESPKDVTLRVAWWGSQTRNERTLQVMDMYKAKNPNITFETEYNGWQGYWDKLATQAAANSLPDIVQQDYAYLGQWSSRNLLEDLTSYTQSGELDVSDVNENVLASGSINGNLNGICLGTNALAIAYDQEILKKAGVEMPSTNWDWDEYYSKVKDVYKNTQIQSDIPLFKDPKFAVENFVRQYGKTFYNVEGTALGFEDTKPMVDFFNDSLELVKSGDYIGPEIAAVEKNVEDYSIVKGEAAITFTWSNMFVGIQKAANRPLTLALIPELSDRSKPGLYVKPSMFFSVIKSSENKSESSKFINYFTNDIDANKVLLADRGVPIANKVREALKSEVEPSVAQTFDYLALAADNSSPIDPPEPAGANEVTKALQGYFEQVLFEKISAQEAADKFVKEANEILSRNK